MKQIIVYFYLPQGMVIFEMTRIKLRRKEAADSLCRGSPSRQMQAKVKPTIPSLGS